MNDQPCSCARPRRDHRGLSEGVLIAALLLSVAAACGCERYERRPLDLDAARSDWLERSLVETRVLPRGLETGAFDPSDGLSLAEAEAVLLVFNAPLRLARLEAGVAQATARHAGQWADPVLGVDLERIVSGQGGWVTGTVLGLTIPISGRLEAEKALAGAELAAALDRLAALEWATRAALRERWVEWSAARFEAEVLDELIERLGEAASLAERQLEAGAMTRVSARLFRVELAGREADGIALRARVMELELHLRDMLGLAPHSPLTLVPGVSFAARATEADTLRELLETSNPELAAVRGAYEVAERALRTEVRRQYPDVTIGPGYGSDQGDKRILLGLSVPVPLLNRNQQAIAMAQARREVERGRFATTYEHLSSQLAIALMRLEASRAQRSAVETSVIPLADEQEADVRRAASLGRVEPLLLLEALKSQHDAQVRLVQARAAEALGAIRLDELIGPPAPRSAD